MAVAVNPAVRKGVPAYLGWNDGKHYGCSCDPGTCLMASTHTLAGLQGLKVRAVHKLLARDVLERPCIIYRAGEKRFGRGEHGAITEIDVCPRPSPF